MSNVASLVLFLTLNVLIVRNDAFYFVNNLTIPSDFLLKIFFEEIQSNPDLFANVSVHSFDTYNTRKCIVALKEIVFQFPSLTVLPFLDSWGNIPSGLMRGHLQDLGNFDQCTGISTELSSATGIVSGQYCFAKIPLFDNLPINPPKIGPHVTIDIGVCVPDACDPNLLGYIFQKANDKTFKEALTGIKVGNCITAKRPDFKAINIAGIAIFSIFGALMVLSTVYDVFTEYFERPAVPLLLAFSVLTNGRQLFAINTGRSANSIDCLTGIRVLSTLWVMIHHNFLFLPQLSLVNGIDRAYWQISASSMYILMASFAVDTFLFISGLLVAWLGLRELDKRKGKLNIPLMYLHRYVRLTPAVAAVILYYVSIDEYIGTGPYRKQLQRYKSLCESYWWSTLLYVSNYVNPSETCIGQAWYLSVDTQLYVLSPLILIPLWKWGRRFVAVMFVLSIFSVACSIACYYMQGWNTFIDSMDRDYYRLVYQPTHIRWPVWLVGVGLGYFMYKNKGQPMRPSKLMQLLGWIGCFTIILALIYGPYFTISADRATTVFEAAMYGSFKRIGWAIALAWLIFACHFGFGGIINSFLSHPWWQPLGRLTFSMYLVDFAVQSINFGITKTSVYFSDYRQILTTWSCFGISLMAAVVLTLAFELPALVIEKAILGSSGNSATSTNLKSIMD